MQHADGLELSKSQGTGAAADQVLPERPQAVELLVSNRSDAPTQVGNDKGQTVPEAEEDQLLLARLMEKAGQGQNEGFEPSKHPEPGAQNPLEEAEGHLEVVVSPPFLHPSAALPWAVCNSSIREGKINIYPHKLKPKKGTARV